MKKPNSDKYFHPVYLFQNEAFQVRPHHLQGINGYFCVIYYEAAPQHYYSYAIFHLKINRLGSSLRITIRPFGIDKEPWYDKLNQV